MSNDPNPRPATGGQPGGDGQGWNAGPSGQPTPPHPGAQPPTGPSFQPPGQSPGWHGAGWQSPGGQAPSWQGADWQGAGRQGQMPGPPQGPHQQNPYQQNPYQPGPYQQPSHQQGAQQTGPQQPGRTSPALIAVVSVLALALVAALTVVGIQWRQGRPQQVVAPVVTAEEPTDPVASDPSEQTTAATSSDPTSEAPTASETPTPSDTPTPSNTPTPTPETTVDQQAKAFLDEIVANDAPYVGFDGRYVAQLASKAEGTVDPLDPPPSGGTAWTWSDLYVQHQALRNDPRFQRYTLLVLSTSYGGAITTTTGQPYYVTMVDGGFSSAAQVNQWCQQTFADLPAKVRANSCVAARLTKP